MATSLLHAESPEQRDTRMAWWREARFGMFVHWGLYSGLAGTWEGGKTGDRGGMEWAQQLVGTDTDTYAARAIPKFRPKPGFAEECRDHPARHSHRSDRHGDQAALRDGGNTLPQPVSAEIRPKGIGVFFKAAERAGRLG